MKDQPEEIQNKPLKIKVKKKQKKVNLPLKKKKIMNKILIKKK